MALEEEVFCMTRSTGLVLAVVAAACSSARPPVPMVGQARDVAALAGAWAGEYSSAQSGRSGSISFTLRAQGDSAFGDVVMIPTGLNRALAPWAGQSVGSQAGTRSEVLTIRFVRVVHDTVSGA